MSCKLLLQSSFRSSSSSSVGLLLVLFLLITLVSTFDNESTKASNSKSKSTNVLRTKRVITSSNDDIKTYTQQKSESQFRLKDQLDRISIVHVPSEQRIQRRIQTIQLSERRDTSLNSPLVDRRRHRKATEIVDTGGVTPSIVGGTPASPGEYPYYVRFPVCCGGTLIRPDIAMTAAHCATCIRSVGRARVGGIKRNGGKLHQVKRVIVHPDYNYDLNRNDVALVQLTCASRLPVVELNFDVNKPAGRNVTTTIGFGSTERFFYSRKLLETNVNNVPIEECIKDYNDTTLYINGTEMICAGAPKGGKDSCKGDSGGPLLLRNDNNNNKKKNMTQIGIVSFGAGCGIAKYPGVYARVSTYKNFIIEVIQNYSSPIPQYCKK